MNKQEKINKIVKEIWHNEYLEDLTFRLSENESALISIFIWDVLDWRIKNKKMWYITWMIHDTIYCWKDLRLPIEEQPEECIDYIYNLLNNETT